MVDRFSGWLNIYYYPPHKAIADTLISTSQTVFISYGIPEEISTDGGPQFTSQSFQTFLKKWEVKHQISSAEYP